MHEVAEFLQRLPRIPDVVWSGLLAAGITLFGVWVANRQNAQRQVEQHKFDASESALNRISQVREEVYLPLAESLQGIQSFLARLPTLKKIKDEPMTTFSACVSKLTLVAETSTALLAATVGAAYSEAYMELYEAARPAVSAKADAARWKKYRVVEIAKADAVQLMVDAHLQEGGLAGRELDALLRSKARHSDLGLQYWATENAALKAHSEHSINSTRLLIEKMPELSSLGARLLLALRRDMRMPTDEPLFLKTYSDHCDHMVAVLESLLARMETLLAVEND